MDGQQDIPPAVLDPLRLHALAGYGILDTPPEKGFDDIVHLARKLCDAPVALVSLVAGDRQWFKARVGFDPCQTPIGQSVCAHVLTEPDLLVIPDLSADPRTRDNTLVTSDPFIRFYAGAPLEAKGGERIGSLCVIDTVPRPNGLTDNQADSLRALAGQVMAQLELRRALTERDSVVAQQTATIAQQEALIETQAAVSVAHGALAAILDALVAGAMRALPQAEGGGIEMRDGDELVYRSGAGSLAPHVGLRLPLKGSLSGHCLRTAQAVLCPDVRLDSRVKQDVIALLNMRSALYVPVARAGAVIGVLKLQSSLPDVFTERDLQVARLFAGSVAAGLAEAGEAEARRDIRRSEATLRSVLETIPVGIIIAEAGTGRITGRNARAEEILGHPVPPVSDGKEPGRWIGFHPDGRRVRVGEWPTNRVARDGDARSSLEVHYRRGNGQRAWVDFEAVPLHEGEGQLTGSVMVVSDTDLRKRSELQLEAAKEAAENANRAKSEFLANMSHELRTPLSAVIGYAEMLQEEMGELGQPDLLADVGKIEGNARHLLGLINDVLDLSKIEAERMEVYAEDFSIGEMIDSIASTVGGLVAKNGNVLTVDLPADIGRADTDVTKLRQCLTNLLGNAAKFTRAGRVTLSATREGRAGDEWLVFQVTDTGIGMTAEQQAGLFQRFTQADSSTTRRFGGTGLGLFITRAFATMLGGTIAAISRPGEGTTFTLQLPACYVEPAQN